MLQTSSPEAELIKLSFEHMYQSWGASQPLRTGLHASSVLVSEQEWCVREHVLAELFSDEARKPEMHPWDWKREAIFENGWDLHKRWQKIFEKFGRVVYNAYEGMPELDLTHYDETRNIYFSPDAILQFGPEKYVVEIKGIKQESFIALPTDLAGAMTSCETVHKAYYQAQLYMHLLQIKKAILLIENKNTQDFRVWVISYDREAALPYAKRTENVKRQTAVTRRDGLSKLPQRICKSRGDARALKCPLRDCCFKEEMEG